MLRTTTPLLRALAAVQCRLAGRSNGSERGAGLAEYALLLALITVATAGLITTFGTAIGTQITNATGAL